MTGLQRADRRKCVRYRVQVAAELVSHAGETAPCAIMDISPTGASVACDPIAEDIELKLRLDGFGAIAVSRLRAKYGIERFLFRDTEFRNRQFFRFLTNLIDAGAALPASDRRQHGAPPQRDVLENPLGSLNDALLRQIDEALNFVARMPHDDADMSNNVLAFRAKQILPRDDPPPDQIA